MRYFLLYLLVSSLVIMMVVQTQTINDEPQFKVHEPDSYTAGGVTYTRLALDKPITIHTVSQKNMEERFQVPGYVTSGFTYLDRVPCEIEIPDTWIIRSEAGRGSSCRATRTHSLTRYFTVSAARGTRAGTLSSATRRFGND